LIWGIWPALSKFGIQQTLNTYDIAALRYLVAGIILAPLVWRKGLAGIGWPGAFWITLGAGFPYALASTGGLNFAPAGHFGVIAPSCMLITSTIGSHLFLSDRITVKRIIGLTGILAGVVLIGWQGLSGAEEGQWIGHIMFASAGFMWAIYTIKSRILLVDAVHATGLVSVLSLILYLPFYLAFGDPQIFNAPASEIVTQAIFQGFLSGFLALILYTRTVAILGAARGALFAALVPGIAVLLAIPVLREIPTMLEILGVLAVTAGMVYSLSLGRK
jgi:drug/metabolite transporter (DMT)-like permease